jgi:hypothetical protein
MEAKPEGEQSEMGNGLYSIFGLRRIERPEWNAQADRGSPTEDLEDTGMGNTRE